MDDCDGRYCYDENCGGKLNFNYKTSDESYCLTCHHQGKYHAELQSRFDRLMYLLIFGRRTGCTTGKWCKCPMYKPNDNLVYLEELVKKREPRSN